MSTHLTSSSPDIRGPVLITGANGNLGRRMILRLAPKVPVTALVRSERAASVLRQELQGKDYIANVSIRVHDYADASAMAETLDGCRSVIHLVGIIKETATSTYEQAQEETTRALLSAAQGKQLERIVYVSIAGADDSSQNTCLASKGRAENILVQGAIPSLILRVPMVLGEGDYAVASLKRRANSRLVFLLRAASLEQPIFAVDVEQALYRGLTCELSQTKVLELSGPESLSRKDLTLRAGQVVGNVPWIVSLPYVLGVGLAWVLERLSSSPPVTPAMLGVLDHDDRVDVAPACEWLGMELTSLDEILNALIC